MKIFKLISKRASAGAGKTFALAVRYLNLLDRLGEPASEKLRRIVGVTFTNKASAEMKERILRFLKEIAFETEFYQKVLKKEVFLTPDKARSWIEVIIKNYFDFQVRTIDSLSVAILRGLSYELGIKPELKVLFKEKEVLKEAFEVLLSYLADPQAEEYHEIWKKVLRTYLTYDERGGFYPEGGLKRRILKEIIPKIGNEDLAIVLDPEIKKQEIEEAFSQLKENYENLYSLLMKYRKILSSHIKIDSKPEPEVVNSEFFLDFNKVKVFLETKLEDFFKVKLKEEERKVFEKIIFDFRQRYENWLKLCQEFAYAKLADYYPFLKELQKYTQELSFSEGLLLGSKHWTQLILKAIEDKRVLPLIYAHFACEFKHFLFDEFQDTSLEQWEALFPILEDVLSSSEESTFFVVVDPKQSIYAWRGGEWQLYHQIFVHQKYFSFIEKTLIKEEFLTQNYRSHPHLISFFNYLFKNFSEENLLFYKKIKVGNRAKSLAEICLGERAPLEIKQEFCSHLLEVFKDYEQEVGKKREEKELYDEKEVRINIFEVGDFNCSKSETIEILRNCFLEKISEEWEKWSDLSEDTPIAVLVRKNEQGEEVSSWLLQEGIPVLTENSLKTSTSLVVKGLISFLKLIENPEVELYLYGFLASGLLPSGPKNEEELIALWLDPKEKEKLKKELFDLVNKINSLIPGKDPYQLLWILMDELDLESRLSEDLSFHRPFVERFLETLHQFVVEEGPSLAKFLKFWEEGGLEAKIGTPEKVKAVRVITIHKAKGLEFPVVFIPFTDFTLRDLTPVEVIERNQIPKQKYIVHLKEPLPEELLKKRYRIFSKNIQEEIHLFYVALTRAKDKLYLFLPIYKSVGLLPLSKWIRPLIKEVIESCEKEGIPINYYVSLPNSSQGRS
ncbi:MAG: UvrD-helicase domain-containing protein [Thermodesulfobacteriaceae bacterium]|nr:UvrD-helicase domain-containing protein [Thermodesulfobacteriaceae bacterium]